MSLSREGTVLSCHNPHGSSIAGMLAKKQDATCFELP